MKMLKINSLLICIICSLNMGLYAAKVDTVSIYSDSMQKKVKTAIILPDNYTTNGDKYPVVYLLHGYSDDYATWIKKVPEIKDLADTYNLMIVCPDGGYSSWYFDSPVDTNYKYETFTSKELISFIDKNYHAIPTKQGRGITGLSMGGHGALYLAFKHTDVYGVAGSQSGGVDIRPFPRKWHLSKRLGTFEKHKENWENNTVINLVNNIKNNDLQLMIECGTKDFFYPVNKKLHEKLLENNIEHDYVERPGKHSWVYWSNSIHYQILFMSRYFQK